MGRGQANRAVEGEAAMKPWRIALGWFCYGAAFGATIVYVAWGLSDGF